MADKDKDKSNIDWDEILARKVPSLSAGLIGSPPQITEEMIARAVARGLAEAAATTTETERDLWLRLFTGPAPFVTRVGIVPHGGDVVRLVFGDQYDDQAPTQYRAAVTMSSFNAYELWKLLGRSLGVQHWREEEEKYNAEQTAKQGGGGGSR